MPASDRKIIQDWLEGGAPYGMGSGDAAPTFVWDLPSTKQTSTTVTVQWHAADDKGLASGTLDLLQYAGTCHPGGVCCPPATGTPSVMAISDPAANQPSLGGTTTWMNSFALTVTVVSGYYHCLRGTVVDTSMQKTIVINPNALP